MPNLLKIVDFISEKIKKDYCDDIAIAAYYGSYVTGTFNEKSDIDIFFIPKTDRGWEMGDCFLLRDIGIDIFPISWERVGRISEFDKSIVSVIADCKVFFSSSSIDLAKFQAFQEKIQNYLLPENKLSLLKKATDKFQKAFKLIYRMEKTTDKNDSSFIKYVYDFLTILFEVYALINQRYFKSGWGKNLKELFNFDKLPDGFENIIKNILELKDKQKTITLCKSLIEDTEEILKEETKQFFKPKKAEEVFSGYYEEIKSTFNKINVACDNDDYELAFFAASNLQIEMTKLMGLQATSFWDPPAFDYSSLEVFSAAQKLPDILSYLDSNNLKELREAVSELENIFVSYLKQNGITLKKFESIESYQQYLELK